MSNLITKAEPDAQQAADKQVELDADHAAGLAVYGEQERRTRERTTPPGPEWRATGTWDAGAASVLCC